MKKRILLSISSMLISCSIIAGIVPIKQAETVALNFYYQKYNQFEGKISIDHLNINSTFIETDGGTPYYYVFHINKGGYVIVSAESLMHPVLAYSFKNLFDTNLEGPSSYSLMHHYKDMISFMKQKNEPQRTHVKEAWEYYLSDEPFPVYKAKDWGSIGPLLTTEWNQGWPYNYYCPEISSGGSGGHTWAGCVATAVQQIFYYHRWPEYGRGSTSYIPENHPEFGVLSADFENTLYRWNEMTDHPLVVNLAIAEHVYHIGVGLHMNYDGGGSAPGISGWDEDSTWYYFKFFQYTPYSRDTVDYEEWIYTLKDNLDRNLPVYYDGSPSSGAGHAFVCDGYQDSAYFHFNLGWGGSSNGYYYIDNIVGYNYDQGMTTEVYPDTIDFVYPSYAIAEDTLTTMEGSIEDGSSPTHDYLNNTHSSWLIDPQTEIDSIANIKIMVKRLDLYNDGDRLYIYDGGDNSAPLLAELGGDSIPGNIVSSGNKVFIEFITDDINTSDGFYLAYRCEQPLWCSGYALINEAAATFDDGSGNFYYYNGAACIWMIDPGLNQPLTLNFNYFFTEEDKDIVKVFDGDSQELLAEISGEYQDPPPPVTSLSGKMMVTFSTSNSVRNDGWEATYTTTSIEENENPIQFRIMPNPASYRINIAYTLYDKTQVKIELYDITGKRLLTLQDKELPSGAYSFDHNIEHLQPGMYFCRMQAGNQNEVRKLIKLK